MAEIGDRGFLVSTILSSFEPNASFKTSSVTPAPNGCSELPYIFPVLAESSFTFDYRNDFEQVIIETPNNADTVDFQLQKLNISNVFVSVGVVNDATYGEYRLKGFNPDRPNFTAYQVEWADVLAAEGIGIYRIRTTLNTAVPSGSTNFFSDLFCLKEYSTITANDTVRLDWVFNNVIGNGSNEVDYGLVMDLRGSRRIQGFFGNEEVEQNISRTEYTNRSIEVISNDPVRKFKLTTGRVSGDVHDLLVDVFMTGTVVVYDFNTNNERNYKGQPVILDSSYAPDYKVGSPTVLSRVTLTLEEQTKKLGKNYCK